MNVLLIAYSYPPDPRVGSFRAVKVAEAFRASGHEVDVITARLPNEQDSLRAESPGLRVHPVRVVPNPRHLFLWAKSLVSRSTRAKAGNSSPSESATAMSVQESTSLWKRLMLSILYLPDDLQGFIVPAVAKSIPQLFRGVDMVYTTAPPFSGHLVGLLIKWVVGIHWIAEFRDPWTDNPERSAHVMSRPAAFANRWLERQCLANADHVVSVAEATRDLLRAKMPPERRDRMLLALNGIDQIDPVDEGRQSHGPFRIVYTGSFSAGRDPRPFLKALSQLKEKLELKPADLQVELIGSGRQYRGVALEPYIRDLKIDNLVRFIDWVPVAQAREHMRAADLLLLLFRDQRIQIPNKLYDYLGTRKPILAMVDGAGEAARMLRRVGGHHLVLDNDPASLERALEVALATPEKKKTPDANSILCEWSAQRQMKKLMQGIGAQ